LLTPRISPVPHLVTALGDKTFFIAAIMAMKYDRLSVFVGAIGALALMTALSSVMGFTLPSLLPRKYTHVAATVLVRDKW